MFLVTSGEMRDLDGKAVAQGIPALLLMENAGKALAEAASSLAPKVNLLSERRPLIGILAGPGQNGGDGFCAARHLSCAGYDVKVVLFGDPAKLPEEARVNYRALASYPVDVLYAADGPEAALLKIADSCVVVDALLGTGQKGSPRPPMDQAVRWANRRGESGVPVVACDIPTGLDSDTGRLYEPAVQACLTVTMGLPKIGLYSYPGRSAAGRVIVEPLGLPHELLALETSAKAVFAEDARAAMPKRSMDHHKGMSGHVIVVAGSLGMAGAAVLAAKAGLRGGAGTVTLLCPGAIYGVCAGMVPEIMVLPCGEGPQFGPEPTALKIVGDNVGRSSCVAVGPGIGRGAAVTAFVDSLLRSLAEMEIPCLIDADGLHAVADLGGLPYLSSLGGGFMLTPHPGELAHLFGVETAAVAERRVHFAKQAAKESNSFVCLKGAGTCVANAQGDIWINTSGDPAMATAGSGDVLSGVVAALVSQGVSVSDSLWLGSFWHGLAGEAAKEAVGSSGILAGEISDYLPASRKAIEGR